MAQLSRREAIQFLELDEKTFENYFRLADEFLPLPRPGNRGRFKFDEDILRAWKIDYDSRTVLLTRNDYSICLDFALAQHFRGYVLSDWGTGRQREFGQKITNWVRGQLAEIAVKKYLFDRFGIDIALDFAIHGEIVPQDIIGVLENGNLRKPRMGIGIKSSKPKNAYLVLGENEISLDNRRSDVYIFCRPEMPDDHLLRIARDEVMETVRGKQHFETYASEIPYFEEMWCEIAGFCYVNDLEQVTSIPGQAFDGIRYVKKSGHLRRSNADWQSLIATL